MGREEVSACRPWAAVISVTAYRLAFSTLPISPETPNTRQTAGVWVAPPSPLCIVIAARAVRVTQHSDVIYKAITEGRPLERTRDEWPTSRTSSRSHTLVDRPVVAVCCQILGEDDELVARAYGALLLLVFAVDHSAARTMGVIQLSEWAHRGGPSRRPLRAVAWRFCLSHQTAIGTVLARPGRNNSPSTAGAPTFPLAVPRCSLGRPLPLAMAILGMPLAVLQGGLGQGRKICVREGTAGGKRTACPRPAQTSMRIIAAVEVVVKAVISRLPI